MCLQTDRGKRMRKGFEGSLSHQTCHGVSHSSENSMNILNLYASCTCVPLREWACLGATLLYLREEAEGKT